MAFAPVARAADIPVGHGIFVEAGGIAMEYRLETRAQIEIIIDQAFVPVVVDAGLGAPSYAAEAMEMGADAVLVNTAIAKADDPVAMARAFRLAVEAGRIGYLAGIMEEQLVAAPSSPLEGVVSRP